jgi:hypothetical protein
VRRKAVNEDVVGFGIIDKINNKIRLKAVKKEKSLAF